MQEIKEMEKKETITFSDLKELINSMKEDEFIIEVPIGGGENGGK